VPTSIPAPHEVPPHTVGSPVEINSSRPNVYITHEDLQGLRADMGIVYDPTNDRVITTLFPDVVRRSDIVRENPFSLREVAEMLGVSYHTARNKALRGEFASILHNDDGNIFIERHALVSYLSTALEIAREEYNKIDSQLGDLVDVAGAPIGVPDMIDVTDENANFAQAVQNIANAFDALAETTTRHHTETEEAISEATAQNDTEYSELRERLTRLEQNLANMMRDLRIEMTRMLSVVTGPLPSTAYLTVNAGAPETVALPPRMSPPAYGRAQLEQAIARAPVAPTRPPMSAVNTIGDDRPDQIVTVRRDLSNVEHRTRNAINVGDHLVLDVHGLHPARPGDPLSNAVGVATAVRDAIPDAAETIQPIQTLTMGFSDRREILHPWRNDTCVLTTDRSGQPAFEPTQYFRMESWRTTHEIGVLGQTTIHWRAF
jgi:hypothetical protein